MVVIILLCYAKRIYLTYLLVEQLKEYNRRIEMLQKNEEKIFDPTTGITNYSTSADRAALE